MTVTEKLNALRSEMKKNQIDAYYIPTNDYHGSEYIGDYFKCREYISGFTGSAGDLIVTEKEAGLWTDGRYYLQAEDQLKGTGITLYRQQEEGVPEPEKYLEQKLQAGQTLGFDGKVVKASFVNRLSGLEARQIEINSSLDLIGTVWKDRPELKFNPAFILEGQYAGVSREEKIKWVYEWMKRQETDFLVLTSLDDIAWLLNIRGSDIRCNPVVLSYMVIGRSERILFGREESFSQEITEALSLAEIERRDYEAIYEYLGGIPAQFRIAMDFSVINYTLLQSVNSMAEVIDTVSPTVLMKAIKNPVEVANVREAHIRDGVAVRIVNQHINSHIE